jgi:hypothetical protein
MTNECQMTNDESAAVKSRPASCVIHSSLGIRHSFVIRHSTFVIQAGQDAMPGEVAERT